MNIKLCLVGVLAATIVAGTVGIRADEAEASKEAPAASKSVSPVALAKMIKDLDPEEAKSTVSKVFTETVSAAEGDRMAVMNDLIASISSCLTHVDNEKFRDAVLAGLAEGIDKVGDKINEDNKLTGEDAKGTKDRLFSVAAATIATATEKNNKDLGLADKFVAAAPEASQESAKNAAADPAATLGAPAVWSVQQTYDTVTKLVFPFVKGEAYNAVLGTETTTTTTRPIRNPGDDRTPTPTRPSPTPVGRF